MDRWAWPTAVKVIAGIMGAGLIGGTVLFLVLFFELTGAFPVETGDFIDEILAGNEWHTARNPLDITQGALYAAGFAALGLLGLLLARLFEPGDSRGPILSGVLLFAGVLGVVAQLLWIGFKPVATSPQYCDCGFLTEEIMSRLMSFNILTGVQNSLTAGAAIAAAIGLVIVARPGVRAGMPSGWAILSYVTAVATVVFAVLWALTYTYPFNLYSLVLVAGVLLPAWAIWLALRADGLRLDAREIE